MRDARMARRPWPVRSSCAICRQRKHGSHANHLIAQNCRRSLPLRVHPMSAFVNSGRANAMANAPSPVQSPNAELHRALPVPRALARAGRRRPDLRVGGWFARAAARSINALARAAPARPTAARISVGSVEAIRRAAAEIADASGRAKSCSSQRRASPRRRGCSATMLARPAHRHLRHNRHTTFKRLLHNAITIAREWSTADIRVTSNGVCHHRAASPAVRSEGIKDVGRALETFGHLDFATL